MRMLVALLVSLLSVHALAAARKAPASRPATAPAATMPAPGTFDQASESVAVRTAMTEATEKVQRELSRVTAKLESSPEYVRARADLAAAEAAQEKVRASGDARAKLDAATVTGKARARVESMRKSAVSGDADLDRAKAEADAARKRYAEARLAWERAAAAVARAREEFLKVDGPGLYRIHFHGVTGDLYWTHVDAKDREDAIRQAKNMRLRMNVTYDGEGKPHYPIQKVQREDDP